MTTNNKNKSFSDLTEKYAFFIPSYQRAYSWNEKQVSLFISDLAEHAKNNNTQYYLGHFILESNEKSSSENSYVDQHLIPVDIVDGQQRLTTVAIFLAVCRYLCHSKEFTHRLQLSVVDYDKDEFDKIILPETLMNLFNPNNKRKKEMTASLERVVIAAQTFHKSFFDISNKPALLSQDKIENYINVINDAAVSVGIYQNKAVAAQIFELHNTRGVLLTETEKIKALLMKYVYLNNREEDVTEIQKSFSVVFKLEEKAASVSFRGEMSLDDVLAHHLRAVDDGKKQQSYTQPQSVEGENGCVAYVRKKLETFIDNTEDGVTYAKNLARELAISMHLVSNVFVDQDVKEPLIGDVILLDQRRSMIFLLRYFRVFDAETSVADHTLLKRWESFLFLWDCHDVFFNMKSGKKDSFSDIYDKVRISHSEVSEMLQEYYSGDKDFAYRKYKIESESEDGLSITGLAGVFQDYITKHEKQLLHSAYNWGHWHGRYKYWLYKYEIEMTEGQALLVRSALRNLFKENDVTLDHIIPHELEWKELSKKGTMNNDLNSWDPDDRRQAEEIWKEIGKTINGIGNLVLLSRSDNASLQNISPFKRASEYRKCKLESLSYEEVATWKSRAEWSDDSKDSWQVKIEDRGKSLLTWMKGYFSNQATWKS